MVHLALMTHQAEWCLQLVTDGSNGATERMRIHQNGVISMGTTDQIGKLSVSGSYNDEPFGRSVITARDDDSNSRPK